MNTPQCAEIIEQVDDGIEVTSAPPGAPVKAPRPPTTANLESITRNLDPLLAHCAVIVNDPDQTKALADFAEMRARCG